MASAALDTRAREAGAKGPAREDTAESGRVGMPKLLVLVWRESELSRARLPRASQTKFQKCFFFKKNIKNIPLP
jgi:hypothetical protein